MKIFKYILLFLGALYTVNGIGAVIFSNFTIGSISCIALGLCFLAFSVWDDRIDAFCKTKILTILKLLVLSGCIFAVAFSVFLEVYGRFDNATGDEDAVIVLGAAVKGTRVSRPLKYRLDAAYEFLCDNPDAVVVVSGGKGFQEDITEAEAMENYLVDLGIAKERIIKEEKATSTYENFKFSKELLDKKFGSEYKVSFSTNHFHVLRAESIAKQAGLRATHIGAGMYWFDIAPSSIREVLAYLKHIVIGN